jgi:hypothetical protein
LFVLGNMGYGWFLVKCQCIIHERAFVFFSERRQELWKYGDIGVEARTSFPNIVVHMAHRHMRQMLPVAFVAKFILIDIEL